MAKIAKAAAKTAAQKSDKDLFSDLGPASRRLSARAARAAKPTSGAEAGYTARDIEVLEGLEPVRRRPGMYIGGTDEKALHHLFAEVIDNSMDEALAGHATFIEVELEADGFVGRDRQRPRHSGRSASEIPEQVGARSHHVHAARRRQVRLRRSTRPRAACTASASRSPTRCRSAWRSRSRASQKLYRMVFERGKPKGKLEKVGRAPNRRGTKVRFRPDPQIFGAKAHFQAGARVQDGALQGLSVRRRRNPLVLRQGAAARASTDVPEKATFHFADGLKDYLSATHQRRDAGASRHLHRQRRQDRRARRARMGGGLDRRQPTASSTPTATPSRRRTAARTSPACAPRCSRGLKDHAERVGQGKRAAAVTSDDVMTGAACMLSVFIREPEFQGQTKDRLATAEATRIVENAIKDPFDHWLAGNPHAGQQAARLRHRARRGAHPPPPGKGDLAQDRGAQAAPARQARRLHQHRRRRARKSSSSRATRPAARPSRRATAPRRRCCRCAARSSTSPPPARTSCAQNQQLCRSGAGARLRHRRALSRRGPALREGHHHDRRRRRRRAHRLAADHLLLPADAEADRRRPPLSRGAAALPPDPRRQERSMRATTSTRTNC